MYPIEENDPNKIALRNENYRTKQTLERRLKALKMFWAKLFGLKITPDDTRTIQKHVRHDNTADYFIASPDLNNGESFLSVTTIKEDREKQEFAYKGISTGGDNVIAVIESNVPLEEIVSSPYGNEALQQMLSEQNAAKARDSYYKSKGLSTERLEGHASYFSNPTIGLGTIIRNPKGRYSFNNTISADIEEMLANERAYADDVSKLRDPNAVEVEISPDWVVAKQDCFLIPDNKGGTGIEGTNSEAIHYRYTGLNTTKTKNGEYYITIGDLRIGDKRLTSEDGKVDFSKSFIYHNVVLYTTDNNIIHYYLNKVDNEINFALGDICTLHRIKQLQPDDNGQIFIGGITLDKDGKATVIMDVPEVIKETAQNMVENSDKIIEIWNK